MSLLYNTLFAFKCKNTHHKLALDALRHMRHPDAEKWRNVFLGNIDPYLDGSKAPDDVFKDFKNHVLHVRQNFWGGALTAVNAWYPRAVEAFRQKKWAQAIYATGVVSHYFTDPLQPFHTGQCEAEEVVHRAAEWSIACSYSELQKLLEEHLGGYPDVRVPAGDDWLTAMVKEGAVAANVHYETLIAHYDIKAGSKNPPAGLDQESKDIIARLIGHAAVGFSRVLDKILLEADVPPPFTMPTLNGVFAALTVPIFALTKRIANAEERAAVLAAYKEYEATGKVLRNLTDDEKVVRQSYAQEILQVPIATLNAEKPGPVGQAHGTGTPARQSSPKTLPAAKPKPTQLPAPQSDHAKASRGLQPSDPIEAAPSIGPKTAERFVAIKIQTVADFLGTSPDGMAKQLNVKHISSADLIEWQQQARLCCQLSCLSGQDAQILVGAGIESIDDLAAIDEETLCAAIDDFLATPEGKRVLRSSQSPTQAEVAQWISAAAKAPPQKASQAA